MQLAVVVVDVETGQTSMAQTAVAAVVVVEQSDRREVWLHPVKDLTAAMLVVTHTHTAARVAVAKPQPVRSAMLEQETAAQVIPTSALCTRVAVAAVVVALLLEVVARVAAARVVAITQRDWELTEQQTRAAAVVVLVRQTLQVIVLAAQAVAALLLCATVARQLDQLQEQQIPLHKQVATPSTPS
jgi:hypothetical protein